MREITTGRARPGRRGADDRQPLPRHGRAPTPTRWRCARSSPTAPTSSGPTRTTPSTWPAPPPTSQGLGVGPGDRVVLMMRNVPAFHFIDLGVAALGATADLDLQLELARAGRVPRRPLPGEGRARRGRRLRGAVPQGARRAPRARDDRRTSATTACRSEIFHGGVGRPRARSSQRVHPRHAGHGDLHVGHHRAAEGRDDHPPQRGVDRRGLPADARRGAGRASGRSRTCRWRTSPSACPRTTSR